MSKSWEELNDCFTGKKRRGSMERIFAVANYVESVEHQVIWCALTRSVCTGEKDKFDCRYCVVPTLYPEKARELIEGHADLIREYKEKKKKEFEKMFEGLEDDL